MHKSFTSLPWHWLPPLITLSLVIALHIDVPYHDQWDLLPLLHAYYQSTLQWQDLLQTHNGHILLFPKLVMLGLAVLTKWNTFAEVLFGFCCMLGNWFLLQKIASTLLTKSLSIAEKAALALLVFSLSQAQNWLWGWQLQIPLALLFILGSVCALLYIRNNLLALFIAALCGIAATCSFAGSLPLWIALIPLLWHRQRILILPWLLFSSVCLLLYARLTGALQPSHILNFMDLAELFRHVKNTLALLGNLVARFNMLAAILAGAFAVGVISLQYRNLSSRQKYLVLTLALFSIGSALMVSLSRAGLGDEQMLASRYGTLTLPLWITVAALLMGKIHTTDYKKFWHANTLLLVVCLLASNIYSLQDFQQMHRRLQRGSAALAHIDAPESQHQIAVINPRHDRAQAMNEVLLLQKYRLSFYRNTSP